MNEQFTSKQAVEEYLHEDDNSIACLICHKRFKMLITHLSRKHGLTADAYREKFNLPWTKGLCCKSTSNKLSKSLKTQLQISGNRLTEEGISRKNISRRRHRGYENDRLAADFSRWTEKRKLVAIRKTEQVLNLMKKEQLPACYFCYGKSSICSMYEFKKGISLDEKLSLQYTEVAKTLPKLIEIKTGFTEKYLIDTIVQMRKQKKTYQFIADTLWISKSQVNRLFHKYEGELNEM